jgi:hypothetical protein
VTDAWVTGTHAEDARTNALERRFSAASSGGRRAIPAAGLDPADNSSCRWEDFNGAGVLEPDFAQNARSMVAQGLHQVESEARIAMTPIPVQITFDGLAHSDRFEAEIRERVAWLQQYYPRMTACRVLLTMPHRHHRAGRQFHITVDVRLPGGGPIVVSQQTSVDDPLLLRADTAIHAAFDAARRQIQDFAREQRVQS